MKARFQSFVLNDTSSKIGHFLKQKTDYHDDEFIPFTNERDSLGRLLTKTPRGAEAAFLPKIKTPSSLLSKIYQDCKSMNNINIVSTPSSLNSIENTIAFESSTWKAQRIKSNAEYKEEPSNLQKPKNQKISKHQFRTMVAHHRSVSSKILWPPSKQETEPSAIITKLEKDLFLEDNQPDKKKIMMLPCTPQKKIRRLKPILKEREGSNTSSTTSTVSTMRMLRKPEIKIQEATLAEDEKDEVDVELDAIDKKKLNMGQDSVGQIVGVKSHFKKLKTEDNKEKYLLEQKAFQDSISNMKSRLRILRSEIGINWDY